MDIACLLVIDCTTSMGWIHRYLRSHLARTVASYGALGRTVTFGVVGFRDTFCNRFPEQSLEKFGFSSTVIEEEASNLLLPISAGRRLFRRTHRDSRTGSPVTKISTGSLQREQNETVIALESLRCFGGGNNQAESSLFAIREGLMMPWPDSRRRIITLFSDERPHMPDSGVPNWTSINEDLVEAGIDQIHLFVTRKKQSDYDELTLGVEQVFFHDLTEDLENLDRSFEDFVRTSSEWEEDEDYDSFGLTESSNSPFDD